jgi:hypothetical protein
VFRQEKLADRQAYEATSAAVERSSPDRRLARLARLPHRAGLVAFYKIDGNDLILARTGSHAGLQVGAYGDFG